MLTSLSLPGEEISKHICRSVFGMPCCSSARVYPKESAQESGKLKRVGARRVDFREFT